MRKLILLALIVAVSLSLACSSGANNTAAEHKAHNKPVEVPTPAAWPGTIALNIAPEPPEPNKPAKFTVTLAGEDGKPLAGAKVRASLIMPEMDMGKNEFDLNDKGGGAYEGEGKFTMAGDWKVLVFAQKDTANGGKVFDTKAVMPKP